MTEEPIVIVDNNSPIIINTDKEGGKKEISKDNLISFQQYINTQEFRDKVLTIAKEKGVTPTSVAKSFVEGVIGTIGDTGVNAVTTIEELINNVTDVVSTTLKGTNTTIADFTKGIIRTITLGKGDK